MSEENTVTFPVGSTVQVMRGQYRHAPVTILAEPDPRGRYAVRTEGGELALINVVNLKAPAEGTITADALALEIQTAINDWAHGDRVDLMLNALASRIGAVLPGFESRISWPVSPQED